MKALITSAEDFKKAPQYLIPKVKIGEDWVAVDTIFGKSTYRHSEGSSEYAVVLLDDQLRFSCYPNHGGWIAQMEHIQDGEWRFFFVDQGREFGGSSRIRFEWDEAAIKAKIKDLASLIELEPFLDMEVIEKSPWQRWIEGNQETIQELGYGQHLAIHPSKGLVYHNSDGMEFARWYRGLDEKEAEELLITTSDMCLA